MIKKRIINEDGRKAEKVTHEETDQFGAVKKVFELYVEPKPQKKLQKRIIEHSKPVVHRRDVEIVDDESGETKVVEYIRPVVTRRDVEVFDEDTNEVIEKKVENIPLKDGVKIKKLAKTFNSAETEHQYVTKADLHASMVMLANLIKENKEREFEDLDEDFDEKAYEELDENEPVVNAQSLLADSIEKKKVSTSSIVLWSVIGIQLVILGYLVMKLI